jgi:uncharacterized protein (DUF433 family)
MRAPRTPRIVRDARILGGAPIVRGTRVTVRAIAFIWRGTGDRARIQQDYLSLTESDIDEAILLYEQHRAELDRDLLHEQSEGD